MAKFIKIGAGWNNDIEYMCNVLEYFDGLPIISTIPDECPKCGSAIDLIELIHGRHWNLRGGE
jgi:hypothetical protein